MLISVMSGQSGDNRPSSNEVIISYSTKQQKEHCSAHDNIGKAKQSVSKLDGRSF